MQASDSVGTSNQQWTPAILDGKALRKREACWHSQQPHSAPLPTTHPTVVPRKPLLAFFSRLALDGHDQGQRHKIEHPFKWSQKPHLRCYIAKVTLSLYPTAPLAQQIPAPVMPAILTVAFDKPKLEPTSFALTYFAHDHGTSAEIVFYADKCSSERQKRLFVGASASASKGRRPDCWLHCPWPAARSSSATTLAPIFYLRRQRQRGQWQPELHRSWDWSQLNGAHHQGQEPPMAFALFGQTNQNELASVLAAIQLESSFLPIHTEQPAPSLANPATNHHQLAIAS